MLVFAGLRTSELSPSSAAMPIWRWLKNVEVQQLNEAQDLYIDSASLSTDSEHRLSTISEQPQINIEDELQTIEKLSS